MRNKILEKYPEFIFYIKNLSNEFYFDEKEYNNVNLSHDVKIFDLEKDDKYDDRIQIQITYDRPNEISFYTDIFLIFEFNNNLVIIFSRTSTNKFLLQSSLPERIYTIFEFPIANIVEQHDLFISLLKKIEEYLNNEYNFSDDYYCEIIEN